MALTTVALASACAADARVIVLASAGTMAPNLRIEIDGEIMYSTREYVSGVTVPVLRGQEGTEGVLHPITCPVKYGAKDDALWGPQGAQTVVQNPLAGRVRDQKSYSASGAIDLPDPGTDRDVFLNAVTTAVLVMTIAAPSAAMDGCELTIASRNGTGAHTLDFAGGLNGAGSAYNLFTFPAGPVMISVKALNGAWYCPVAPAITGTVTLLTGGIA